MNRGLKKIIIGVGIMVITGIITMLQVAGDGPVFIFYGAFVVGLIIFGTGVAYLIIDGINGVRNRRIDSNDDSFFNQDVAEYRMMNNLCIACGTQLHGASVCSHCGSRTR